MFKLRPSSPASGSTERSPHRSRARSLGVALSSMALAGTVFALQPAAASGVTCTLLVGGKPSVTKTIRLDEDGPGRRHMYLEANQYQADVIVEAVAGQIEAGMEMYWESAFPAAQFYEYAVLRGTVPGDASQYIRLDNGRLECQIV